MSAVRMYGLCLVTVIVMFNDLMAVTGQPTTGTGNGQNQECDLNSERDHASIMAEIRAAKVDQISEIKAVKIDVLKKIQDSAVTWTNQPSQGLPTVSSLPDHCIPLLIQQNVDGSNFFNRSWQEYKVGFNGSNGNYWLGNDLLHELTKEGRYKLRFELQQYSTGSWFWAEYTRFIVLSEAEKYQISVGIYTGNTGYDALAYHDTMYFSTWDRDNDPNSGNCAVIHGGGFWNNAACHHCGVNMARSAGYYYWYGLSGGANLQTTRMWLTCR